MILALLAMFEGAALAEPLNRGPFSDVSLSWHHACALRSSGEVVCWGESRWGKTQPPPGRFRQVMTATDHTCALPVDSDEPVCWGFLIGEPPSAGVESLQEGTATICGLDEAGEAHCWGYSADGMHIVPKGPWTSLSSAGCGIRPSGEVDCWGLDLPEPPEGRFVSVSVGPRTACALDECGKPSCWGEALPAEVMEGSWVQLELSARAGCGRRADGTLLCWGPVAETPEGAFVDLDVTVGNACGVREDGSLECWVLWRTPQEFPWPGGLVSASEAAWVEPEWVPELYLFTRCEDLEEQIRGELGELRECTAEAECDTWLQVGRCRMGGADLTRLVGLVELYHHEMLRKLRCGELELDKDSCGEGPSAGCVDGLCP